MQHSHNRNCCNLGYYCSRLLTLPERRRRHGHSNCRFPRAPAEVIAIAVGSECISSRLAVGRNVYNPHLVKQRSIHCALTGRCWLDLKGYLLFGLWKEMGIGSNRQRGSRECWWWSQYWYIDITVSIFLTLNGKTQWTFCHRMFCHC